MPGYIDQSLRETLLASIAGDNLVVLCGAGLSMAHPSCLPSAWQVAQHCVERYYALTGTRLPDHLANDIEQLAEHFLARSEFQNVLLAQLIDWSVFIRSPPNDGHLAIADLLGSRQIPLALSLNVDSLIESAALQLGEPDFLPIVFEADINRASHPHGVLLKLHGCANKYRWETIWCKSQIANDPIQTRLAHLVRWVQGHLPNRDLLVVGYWTDWAYLNEILDNAIVSTEPRSVILVDPSTGEALQKKSPQVWDWANRSTTFRHIQASGDAFLSELRCIVSQHLIQTIWDRARPNSIAVLGWDMPAVLPRPFAAHSAADLYRLRRDVTGVPMNAVVRNGRADESHILIGVLQMALCALGARCSSNVFEWNGCRLRMVHTPAQPLSAVKRRFAAEPPDPHPADRTICVGALDDGGAPANIVRRGIPQGIVRNSPAEQWETHDHILSELRAVQE